MFAALVPAGVVVVATDRDDAVPVVLPGEEADVARAVDSRRAEYATVRRCAREALARLGVPPAPLPRGERGAPRWPAGVVGSMTHCAGLRAAAVAGVADLRGIGIDAEPHAPLPEGVAALVTRTGVDADVHPVDRPDDRATAWDRLLFSAKEAVYKAWFPLTGRFLEFDEVAVTLRADGEFSARVLVPGAPAPWPTRLDGRWAADAGLLLTAVAVPHG